MDKDDVMDIKDMIIEVYSQKTGRPPWVIIEDMRRDTFMSATEALDYGIVDFVGLDPILHKFINLKT